MRVLFWLYAKCFRKNPDWLPPSIIKRQLHELRPLPIGVKEFHEWSDRIISGAMVSADVVGQKFALSSMIMHLKPTESHFSDAYFIHCLRKAAANQVAHQMFQEFKKQMDAREGADTALKVVPPRSDKIGEAKLAT